MKEIHEKINLEMIHRYAYYVNNNIFDAPNAISQNTPWSCRKRSAGWNFRRDNRASVPDFIRFSLSLYILQKGSHALFVPAARRLWRIEAESRRLLIDRSSLIFCQIGRITVRRLNELPRWLSLTSLHGSQKRHFPSFSAVCENRHYFDPSQGR